MGEIECDKAVVEIQQSKPLYYMSTNEGLKVMSVGRKIVAVAFNSYHFRDVAATHI